MSDRRGGSGKGDFDYERIFTEPDVVGPSPGKRLRSVATPWRIGAAVALIALLVVATMVRHQFDPPGSPTTEVTVDIPAGATTTGITDQLAEQGVIPSGSAMRIWIRIERDGLDQFQAGEYTFHRNSAAGTALEVLRSGPDKRVDRLTIPEGFRLEQFAESVGRMPGMTAQRFREIANSGTVRSDFQPDGVTNLEGFLFPDTYLLGASDDEQTLLTRMVNRFDAVARQTGLDRANQALQQTPYDALIIASMIEAEAKVEGDRGKISQVIQNRLAAEMPLQIDATILYALGNDRQAVALRDLEVDDPMNTYKNTGLPPQPIGNPGAASIEAALAPEPGPWLFYVVTETSGAHSFATDLQQHQRNVEIARQRGFIE